MVFEANNSKAVDYLEKKYNEKFVGIKWYDGDVYECYPASNEDWIVKVYFLEEDGKKILKDDYYRWLKRDEYNRLVNNIIKQWFSTEEIKVFSSFGYSWFQDEYMASTPLTVAMAKTPRNFSSVIWIFIAEDDRLDTMSFETKCNSLAQSFREADFHTTLKVFAVKSDVLENIVEDNYPRYFLDNGKSRDNGYLFDTSIGVYANY